MRARVWFRLEADYDPTVALRALSVPALFIFGDQDQLVPVARSIEIIRDTLTRAGHRDFEIVVFPGADHGIRIPSAGERRRRGTSKGWRPGCERRWAVDA